MTLNSDVKLWFQKWHEKLGEISLQSTQKSEKLHIDWLLLSKAYNISVRKFQRNFKEKLTYGFNNDLWNLVNFQASSQKFENLQFDRILLSKAYKDLDEKI